MIKQDIRIYVPYIAGQKDGPIGLKFFVDTQGWPGGDKGLKKSPIFFFKIFFSKFIFPRATPGPSANIIYNFFFRLLFDKF